jgi:hypothetical protein
MTKTEINLRISNLGKGLKSPLTTPDQATIINKAIAKLKQQLLDLEAWEKAEEKRKAEEKKQKVEKPPKKEKKQIKVVETNEKELTPEEMEELLNKHND